MLIKQNKLTFWILLGMIIGAVIGGFWPEFGMSLRPLATIFIHLMLMIVVPLVFSALVVAMAGSGPIKRIGSIAWQTLGFAFVFTALMLALGLLLGHWFQPGESISIGTTIDPEPTLPEPLWLQIVPKSALAAMASNNIIQVVIFSVLFGIAVNLAGDKGTPVLTFCRSLLDVSFKLTHIVMFAAPIGVAGAIAAIVGEHGFVVGETFVKLIIATYIGLAVIILVILPTLLLYSRIPLIEFIKALKEPVLIAFSTSSVNASWPVALENLEKLKIPTPIASFALFTGPFNLPGSTLFIGVAGMFLLQAGDGNLIDQGYLAFFITLYIAGKSVFGPRGSILALVAALGSSGMDPNQVAAGFALLVGIDPLLDMPRTGVNIMGTMTTASLVSRWQNVQFRNKTSEE